MKFSLKRKGGEATTNHPAVNFALGFECQHLTRQSRVFKWGEILLEIELKQKYLKIIMSSLG